jgi:K+-transporting ATPase ATPase C chain
MRPLHLRPFVAALRVLLVLTAVLGVAYPLAVAAVAQLPGLRHRADGSLLTAGGRTVGSALIGQRFTDARGRPLVQYLQPRPSVSDYDPTATGASNLGPESVVDRPGAPSLLTQVCARSVAVGRLEGVDGSRPYCADGVGAVLAVFPAVPARGGVVERAVSVNQPCPARPFLRTYRGVRVTCAEPGADYAEGRLVPVRGRAPASPVVPADAVTASGSAVDPEISLAYARLQEPRLARARGVPVPAVAAIVDRIATGRDLGFLGEAKVNVLRVNIALDRAFPYRGRGD